MTAWAVAHQAPLSVGFSSQEYWSALLFPTSADLADPGIEPGSPELQADSLPTELSGKPLAGLFTYICLDSHPLATPVNDQAVHFSQHGAPI